MSLRDFFTSSAIDLVERGLVPDSVTRQAMSRLCAKRLGKLNAEFECCSEEQTGKFAAEASQGPIAPVPEKANEQHYEVPAEFFHHVLGPRRKYSSCFWEPTTKTLAEAEDRSLEETCGRAQLADGQRILELGCGWGSLTLWMAEHYPTAEITAVSNSSSQREYITAEAERRGIGEGLHVITADMNDFEPEGQFDRVVSVEMFEHMRNHARLMERIRQWLHDDGKLFVHVFCHRLFSYPFNDDSAEDWMSRYFFSGGIMPSESLLLHYDQDLSCIDRWTWNGRHYAKTADAWVENMDKNREQIMPILNEVYGARDAARWFQRWRMLFMAGSELFQYAGGNEWYVAHYLFGKK
ncbi:MAG TPA: SAM-dependent methyltransferase [Planctomycetaceae bacterium]|nr:SAM-dependent methyltransferase [Blastopirellula sp.]HAY81272.1 SAM-dependent methyltransferase [Planctomycetaceae bacterium]